jgi:excisionase family DNA binding protein
VPMNEEQEFLSIPGYVPVKVAAKMLGLSDDRILQHIQNGRLSSKKIGGRYLIPMGEVEKFQLNPPGRVRTKAPGWRLFDSRVKLLNITIYVKMRQGQEERITQLVQEIHDEQRHRFTGTMARYILKSSTTPDLVTISLLWKSNEIPNEQIRQRDLEAFKAEFASVLDWETARIEENEGLLYT